MPIPGMRGSRWRLHTSPARSSILIPHWPSVQDLRFNLRRCCVVVPLVILGIWQIRVVIGWIVVIVPIVAVIPWCGVVVRSWRVKKRINGRLRWPRITGIIPVERWRIVMVMRSMIQMGMVMVMIPIEKGSNRNLRMVKSWGYADYYGGFMTRYENRGNLLQSKGKTSKRHLYTWMARYKSQKTSMFKIFYVSRLDERHDRLNCEFFVWCATLLNSCGTSQHFATYYVVRVHGI